MRASDEERGELRSRFGAIITGLVIVAVAGQVGISYVGGKKAGLKDPQHNLEENAAWEMYSTLQDIFGWVRTIGIVVAIATGSYTGLMYSPVAFPFALLLFLAAFGLGAVLRPLIYLYPFSCTADLLGSTGIPVEREHSVTLRWFRRRLGAKGLLAQAALEASFFLGCSYLLLLSGIGEAAFCLASALLVLHLLAIWLSWR
jgi:hypothetical protein